MKKIGYCTNYSFTEDGKPCPKAETKEDQLLLNPFTLRCELCDQDLKFEFLQDPNKKKKKMILFSKIFAGVLLIVALVFVVLKFTKNVLPPPNGEKNILAKESADSSKSSAISSIENTTKVDSTKAQHIKDDTKNDKKKIPPVKIVKTTPPKPPHSGPITIDNSESGTSVDRYEGQMRDGKRHGEGVYYFYSRQLISNKSSEKYYGEAGDTLKGKWDNGNFYEGWLYYKNAKNGKRAIHIIIGK